MTDTIKKRSSQSLVLGMTMFVMGGCGLAYEYTFSKVAADLLGNSARQWAIIIGVMLFFMGIGADLQKYLKDQRMMDKLVISEILLGLSGGFGPLVMLWAYSHLADHYILVQYFFICSIGLLIGFEIPLITRINEGFAGSLKVNLASILKMDYIGSLCGALIWIFVLLKYFTTIEAAFVLAISTLLMAAFTLFYFRYLVVAKLGLTVVLLLSLLACVYGFTQAKSWTLMAEQYLYRDRIVLAETSKYQHVVVTQSAAGELNCYINGHLQFNSSDEAIYHENLVHPAMHLAPVHRRVLILGGGDGLALREVLKYKDVESVTLVDLDPAMTDLASSNPHFVALNKNSLQGARVKVIKNHQLASAGKEIIKVNSSPRPGQPNYVGVAEIDVINVDAASFVEQVAGKFDVIIMDFPDPNALELAKLYAKTFYEQVRKRLSRDGILVQQSTSPVHAKEAYLCIGRTLKASGFSVVPTHDNVPSFGEWGWWIGGHAERYREKDIREALMSQGPLTVEASYLTPALIRASLAFGHHQLETSHKDITTLSFSRVYQYYLQGWKNEGQ